MVAPREEQSTERELQYPLTPPDSDCSDSRPRTPDNLGGQIPSCVVINVAQPAEPKQPRLKRRVGRKNTLFKWTMKLIGLRPVPPKRTPSFVTLRLTCASSSKASVSAAATLLARQYAHKRCSQPFTLSVDVLNSILEGMHLLLHIVLLLTIHFRRAKWSPFSRLYDNSLISTILVSLAHGTTRLPAMADQTH